MDEEFLLRFLYDSESDSLDFKRDQYKFTGAAEDDKSELLKDIISMANSWRRVDGFIIIGILDKPEKPNELFGITEHIDDACLQQFVNSKTNRICEFSYKTFTNNGLTFGILKIPIQKRPIYLKKEYGKLKKDIVYVRRGSSTTEASIDEISQMGKEIFDETKTPKIDINFFNSKDGICLGKAISATAFHIEVSEIIPDYRTSNNNWSLGMENEEYYREFYEYIDFHTSYKPFYIQLENTGNIEANNIKIEITFTDIDFDIKCDGDEVSEPRPGGIQTISHANFVTQSEYYIERKSNRFIIYSTIQSLHAKRALELNGIIYINPLRKRTLDCEAKIFCDKLEQPFNYKMHIDFEYEFTIMSWHEFIKYLKDKGIPI